MDASPICYKEIYEPYNEAYALLKMIKDCGHDNSDELWAEFATKTEEFVKKHDTDIGHSIARMITDVADSIADINGKEREGKIH